MSKIQKAKIIKVHDNLVIIFVTRPGSIVYNAGFQYTYNEAKEWLRANLSPEACESVIDLLDNVSGFGDHIEVRMK